LLDGSGGDPEGVPIAIRFELDDVNEGAVAFGYSPLLESVLSLHVLAEPKHHALQHQWVRAMRRLPAPLRREISSLSFLYRWTIPDCLLPAADTAYEGFDVELERLRGLRTEVAAFELLRPLYDHGGGARPARRRILASPEVRAVALRHAGRLGPEARRAATLLFDDPARLVERFASLLEAYWEAAFAAEWERIEPKLAESVERSGRQIARDGWYAFLLSLAPQLRVDPGGRSFGLDVPHEHRVEIGPGNPLLLVPSVYVWPHVRVNCDAPWPLAVLYRAPYLVDGLRRSTPPQLVALLRALADPTRLRILELVAERPRSTQELAPLVGLTAAGASKQLRLLADAGLLSSRRDGYYVVYSLEPERLSSLSDELGHLLGGGLSASRGGDPGSPGPGPRASGPRRDARRDPRRRA
jgi:DNA-binding transcriptional ArsR family regulator